MNPPQTALLLGIGGLALGLVAGLAALDSTPNPLPKLDPKMCELLLTVLALSQEGYRGPASHAIPKRLSSTLRRARAQGYVYVDADGIYLEEEGAAALSECGYPSRPFSRENPTEILDTAVYDTSEISDIRGIGYVEDGQLVTFHVTDHPEQVKKILSKPGARLMAAYGSKGVGSELGSGLYVSGNPEYWVNRARGKWSFLKGLSGDKLTRLLDALQSEVEDQRAHNRISDNEYEHGMRDLRLVRSGDYDPNVLTMFAGQPYNIKFWKPEFLEPLGIDPGEKPRVVEIRIKGKIADIRSGYHPELFRVLRRAGVVGAFTRAGMSTNPELVLWDARAVTSVQEVPL